MADTAAPRGLVRDVAMLDLSTLRSAEELAGLTGLRRVAVVVVPESLVGALMAVPMEDVASIVPVPDGARLAIHTGTLVTDGAALANPGGERDVLMVTGALVLTSPVERVGYRAILVTGVVLAPRGSEAALGPALTRVTGSLIYFDRTEDQQVRVLQGQTSLRGDFLANAGGRPGDLLLVAGQLTLTTPTTSVGFSRVLVAGQLLAPAESEQVLQPVLEVLGQVVWYEGTVRAFAGSDRFGREFFELLDGRVTLVLAGEFELEPDVPAELLRERVAAIVLAGELRAPRRLVAVLQVLATHRSGKIVPLPTER